MVTIALKSEALFAIIGVGAVFVTVCVAAALCYTCQRRRRRLEEGGGPGKRLQLQGEMVEGIALTDLPARARSRGNMDRDTAKWGARGVLPAVEGEETKIEASATPPFRFEAPGGLPTASTLPPQPPFSQSARLDPELFQQTFSTYESLYRAQSETSASVPPSPDPHSAASGAWPSQSAARTRAASRLTNVTLADIALPSTPTKLPMTSTLTGAATGEPDHASSASTSTLPPPSRRAGRSMSVVVPPPAAVSLRQRTFPVSEVPPSPRLLPTAGARGSRGGGGSALASRPRSRSVGASTIPPPAYKEVHGAGQKSSPPIARSRSAAAPQPKKSLDGGMRPVGGWLSRPVAVSVATAASNAPHSARVGGGQPRSYFDD